MASYGPQPLGEKSGTARTQTLGAMHFTPLIAACWVGPLCLTMQSFSTERNTRRLENKNYGMAPMVMMMTLEMSYIWCHQVSPKITGLPPKLRIGFAPSSCPHFASREVAPGDLAPQLNGTSEPWRLLSWNPFNERRFQQILRAYNNAPTKS